MVTGPHPCLRLQTVVCIAPDELQTRVRRAQTAASPASRPSGVPPVLIGYARVSTEDQLTAPQAEELRAAGCAETHEEHASGASRSRPVLAGSCAASGPATCWWWSGSTASPARSATCSR